MSIKRLLGIALLMVLANQVWARDHHFRPFHPGLHGYPGGHSHSGFGLYLGWPLFSYRYYPYYSYPYNYPYYPPTVITTPPAPPVYIEQAKPEVRDYPAGYWYYCRNPDGYYPYVKTCPEGWLRVDPLPPDAN